MKKYIVLGVILLNTLGSLFASTWHSADVTLTYRYCNDLESRSSALVPQRLRSNLNPKPTTLLLSDQAYCVTFKVSFFSTKPTSSLDHIKETVIDKLELNEFATLRVFSDQDEELTTSKILMNTLHKTNLNIIYDPEAILLKKFKVAVLSG